MSEWGPGEEHEWQKPFKKIAVGAEQFELFMGKHAHSRNYNNIYAKLDKEVYAFSGTHPLIDVQFHSYNYLKTSGLSGDEIRKGGECLIFSDKCQVYSFFYRDIDEALYRAARLLIDLREHPAFILDKESRDKLPGRKIYWRRKSAIITRFLEEGCVIIQAENGILPPPIYYLDGDEDYEEEETVKDDVFSKEIWWFRK